MLHAKMITSRQFEAFAIMLSKAKYVVLEMQGIDPRTSRMLSERSTI